MSSKKFLNLFKTSKKYQTPKGEVGYDNARENIDPRIVTKAILTKEIIGQSISGANLYAQEGISGADLYISNKAIIGSTDRTGIGQLNIIGEGRETNTVIRSDDDNALLTVSANTGGTGIGANQDPIFRLNSAGAIVGTVYFDNTASKICMGTGDRTDHLCVDTNGVVLVENELYTPKLIVNTNELTVSGAKVGIGTATPGAKLEVQGNSASVGGILISNENNRAHTWFPFTDGNIYITGDDQTGAGDIIFRSDNGSTYTEHMRIAANGPITASKDLLFSGNGNGLPYGSTYGNHIALAIPTIIQNTWYAIKSANLLSGDLNNVTQSEGALTVTHAGKYIVNWSCCFEDDAANDHVEMAVSGAGIYAAGQAHLENKFASEEEHMSSSCILDLGAGQTIRLAIRTTDAGTPSIAIQAANITAAQIGG